MLGTRFALCWGFDPVLLTDFHVSIDKKFKLNGPTVPVELVCTMGLRNARN